MDNHLNIGTAGTTTGANRLWRTSLFFWMLFLAGMLLADSTEIWRGSLQLLFIIAVVIHFRSPSRPGDQGAGRFLTVCLVIWVIIDLAAAFLSPDLAGMNFADRSNQHFYQAQLFFAAGFGVRDHRQARELLLLLLWVIAFAAVRELVLIGPGSYWQEGREAGRFAGVSGYHPNLAAMLFLLELSVVAASAALITSRKMRILVSILAVSLFGLLFHTMARYTLLTLMLVTIPLLLIFAWRKVSTLKGVIRMAGVIATALVMGGAAWIRLAPPLRSDLSSAYSRIHAWMGALEIAGDAAWYRLLIGHGNFRGLYDKLYQAGRPWLDDGYPLSHSHNIVTQVLLENGVLGVCLLAMIWGVVLTRLFYIWRDGPSGAGIFAGVLLVPLGTVLCAGLMDHAFNHYPGRLAFMLLGMAASLALIVPPGPKRQANA
jgi:O-antigen ligase